MLSSDGRRVKAGAFHGGGRLVWKYQREQILKCEGHGEKQLPPEGATEEEPRVRRRKWRGPSEKRLQVIVSRTDLRAQRKEMGLLRTWTQLHGILNLLHPNPSGNAETLWLLIYYLPPGPSSLVSTGPSSLAIPNTSHPPLASLSFSSFPFTFPFLSSLPPSLPNSLPSFLSFFLSCPLLLFSFLT